MLTGKTTNPASKPFDAASHLRDDAGISEFILAMLEDGDERLIPVTLRTVADAVGMSELSRRTGLDRSHLYSALSESGNPRLDTMATVARAFGLRVTLAPVRTGKVATNRKARRSVKAQTKAGKSASPARKRA